uniref:Ribosomal protein L20 n=1 Tax=Ancoracysta twista TaxID=2044563 RepID=A0A2H4R8D9_9EUKA|nr:ribosomal protein L20 [Ancoracysta twista]ATY40920.1 ribosomal protein L20 [Ancoracysta twista]
MLPKKSAPKRSALYGYSHRRLRKRNMKGSWITAMNAGLRPYGLTYSFFMARLRTRGIILNRKMIVELILREPFTFRQLLLSLLK